MGINYIKGNSKEKNTNSSNNKIIKSNLNEKKTSINNFIQLNSLFITESKNQLNLNIKKSNLNINCTIENIIKLSENITSNYFQKEFFPSNQSLYTSLFLFKDLHFNQQTIEKIIKQRIKKLKKIFNIQNFNKFKIRNSEQTQSIYSKNKSFINDINSNLNDTRSKIFNIYKNEEFNSNYNIKKQNSIIKEEKEYDTYSSPLILKDKILNENVLLNNKKFFHLIQKKYSNQIRNITLNKKKDDSLNLINNEIINSNRSLSPKFRNNSKNKSKTLQLTKFYMNDNNNNNNNYNIFNCSIGSSLVNFFQENLSSYNQIYENEKNNSKSINNFYKEKNTLKHKLINTKFKIDIKEFIKDKNNNKINRFNILKKKNINDNLINKTNFITQYEKYIGNDQSYKTKKPIIYNTNFNELNSKTIMNKILNEPNDNKIKNTLGNIIEEDCDFNNISYLDLKVYNQKKENLPSLNKEFFNKSIGNNKVYNTIMNSNTHRKGSTNFTSFQIEKKESKK